WRRQRWVRRWRRRPRRTVVRRRR
ncbi:hypothetical protein NJB18001_33390, partial [Mycobacterium marinum]